MFNHAVGSKTGFVKLSEDTATQNTRVIEEAGNIPICTLDSLDLQDVDMIKIDVGGYEMEVLKGAHKTLTFNDENQSNVKFLMVELNHNTEKYKSSNKEVKEHIVKNLGFKVLMSEWPDIVYYRV